MLFSLLLWVDGRYSFSTKNVWLSSNKLVCNQNMQLLAWSSGFCFIGYEPTGSFHAVDPCLRVRYLQPLSFQAEIGITSAVILCFLASNAEFYSNLASLFSYLLTYTSICDSIPRDRCWFKHYDYQQIWDQRASCSWQTPQLTLTFSFVISYIFWVYYYQVWIKSI